jgi:hypothetical protein
MSPDPEPDHLIINLHTDRTVIEIDPDGIHEWRQMSAFTDVPPTARLIPLRQCFLLFFR